MNMGTNVQVADGKRQRKIHHIQAEWAHLETIRYWQKLTDGK
jgi:hypothetical protein